MIQHTLAALTAMACTLTATPGGSIHLGGFSVRFDDLGLIVETSPDSLLMAALIQRPTLLRFRTCGDTSTLQNSVSSGAGGGGGGGGGSVPMRSTAAATGCPLEFMPPATTMRTPSDAAAAPASASGRLVSVRHTPSVPRL